MFFDPPSGSQETGGGGGGSGTPQNGRFLTPPGTPKNGGFWAPKSAFSAYQNAGSEDVNSSQRRSRVIIGICKMKEKTYFPKDGAKAAHNFLGSFSYFFSK